MTIEKMAIPRRKSRIRSRLPPPLLVLSAECGAASSGRGAVFVEVTETEGKLVLIVLNGNSCYRPTEKARFQYVSSIHQVQKKPEKQQFFVIPSPLSDGVTAAFCV